MGYETTKGVVIYWKPDQDFDIHRDHLFLFDEYNSSLYIEDKHTSGSVIFQQDTESLFHSSYLLNFIPFELYLTYTPLSDTTILTY